MRVDVRRVVQRPRIAGRALIQLSVRAGMRAVPLALIRRPITYSRSASRGSRGKQAGAHACRPIEAGGVVPKLLIFKQHVAAILGFFNPLRGAVEGIEKVVGV